MKYTLKCYIAFAAQNFEGFLLQFQSEQPMIHLLYQGMCKLFNSILMKLFNKKVYMILLEISKARHKSLQMILQTKRTLKRFHYLKLEPKPRFLCLVRYSVLIEKTLIGKNVCSFML